MSSIQRNTAFTVQIQHDEAADVTAYRLYIDGVVVAEQAPDAVKDQLVTISHAAGLPKGEHQVKVSAVNAEGETFSDVFPLTVLGVPPSKPIIVTITMISTPIPAPTPNSPAGN